MAKAHLTELTSLAHEAANLYAITSYFSADILANKSPVHPDTIYAAIKLLPYRFQQPLIAGLKNAIADYEAAIAQESVRLNTEIDLKDYAALREGRLFK